MRATTAITAAVMIVLTWNTEAAKAWTEVARLRADFPMGVESVAISGPLAVIGGPTGQLHFDTGAAVIFEHQQGEWRQAKALFPNEQCGLEGCNFGVSVAMDGDRLVVGASFIGKAFVYERTMGNWQPTATLSVPSAVPYPRFGEDVDLQGDRLAVSAPEDGRVYVFDLANGVWSRTAVLQPGVTGDQIFGQDISLDGDRVLVSGEDTAYLFDLVNGVGDVMYLNPPNLPPETNFGVSVSLDGNQALVGADFHDKSGLENSGAAYVFMLDGDDWVATDMLVPTDPKRHAHFGMSVSLDDSRALIAAPHYDQAPGEAYIFEPAAGGDWRQTAKLPLEGFGGSGQNIAVQLDVGRAIVGGLGQAAVFVMPPALFGDFDRNGLVDEDDYLTWRHDFGANGSGLHSDGNHNGIVDAADYVVWRLGMTTGSSPVVTTVPEPTTALLVVVIGVAGLFQVVHERPAQISAHNVRVSRMPKA